MYLIIPLSGFVIYTKSSFTDINKWICDTSKCRKNAYLQNTFLLSLIISNIINYSLILINNLLMSIIKFMKLTLI